MAQKRERNTFLEARSDEDESDYHGVSDAGYDSEAADEGLRKGKGERVGEIKGRAKRRKVDTGSEEEEEESDGESVSDDDEVDTPKDTITQAPSSSIHAEPTAKNSKTLKSKSNDKTKREGIIYLTSLPPHLKPSALKNMLQQRGFSPVTRLFLTPIKASSGSKSRARKSYAEGWVQFASHRTAKKCVETLNAAPIGGPKRSYYHDDLWNMRYLRGMTWTDLMAQIIEERREEEVRKAEERRRVRGEVEQFLQGVERSKKEKTKTEKEKRKRGGHEADDVTGSAKDNSGQPGFQWKQFQVKNRGGKASLHDSEGDVGGIDEDTKRVLGKIF